MGKCKDHSGFTAIYVLCDPRQPQVVRYVGKTGKPKKRLENHRARKRFSRAPVARWMRKLQESGVAVEMRVIEWTIDWPTAERKWIAHYRVESGDRLLNIEDGGLRQKYSCGGPRKTVNPDFSYVLARIGLLIRKRQAAGRQDKADKLQWSMDVVRKYRAELMRCSSDEEIDRFDSELKRDLYPEQCLSREERRQKHAKAVAKMGT